MAIMTVTSNHPEFTQLIKKHPEGGLLLRGIRNGTSFGWYETPQTYCLYFQDYGTVLSFRSTREEQQHYLNVKQYSAPQAYLALMTEFLKSAMKEPEAGKSDNQLTITMVEIKKLELFHSLQRVLSDFDIQEELLLTGFYRITIAADSLYKLLHGSYILLLLLAKESSTFLDESDTLIQRCIQSLHAIKAPYYVRNLFVRKFLYSKQSFIKYQAELEANSQEQISFTYRGTSYSRIEKVKELLDLNHAILDVGCGGGAYFHLAKKVNQYIGIDIDPDVLAYAKERSERMELTNIQLFASLEEADVPASMDILLMEVIEHMSKDEAKKLLQKLLQLPFHQLILSTPNKDFNSFYGLSADRKRHEDHQFEFTEVEFKQWLTEIVGNTDTLEFFTTGDQVNGIATTQGARIKKEQTA
ncbi:class I SAM-dependent methyltransferase [Enterococcus sp. AZ072]|uniref:class I SAM-dependent methyltransferase n=1 Tax=unclassified Enterococcus TaxID=2608891 RepID=UPI003D290481